MKAIKAMFLCPAFSAVFAVPTMANAKSMGDEAKRNWSSERGPERSFRMRKQHSNDQQEAGRKRSRSRKRNMITRNNQDQREASRLQRTDPASGKFRTGQAKKLGGDARFD